MEKSERTVGVNHLCPKEGRLRPDAPLANDVTEWIVAQKKPAPSAVRRENTADINVINIECLWNRRSFSKGCHEEKTPR